MDSSHRGRLIAVVLLLLTAAGQLPAQDSPAPAEQAEQAMAEELQKLTRLVRLSRETQDERIPLELHPTAILAYRDPARERSDSRVWLALSEGQPAALLTLSLQPPGSPVKRVFEAATLSDEPIVVEHSAKEWRLSSLDPVWLPLKTDAEVAASERLRILQMKRLVQRFQVRETQSQDGVHTLRLMPAPIYQAATETGDMALFAFAYGTNPEVVVALRSHRDPAGSSWQYALAALAAAELSVSLDDHVVWTQPRFLGRHTRSRYVGAGIPPNAVPLE